MPKDLLISLTKNIKIINSYNTRNHILKVFKTDRYKPDIEWNKNKDLFVFEDCIYDLSIGKFIKPNPEQYLNCSCGYKYKVDLPTTVAPSAVPTGEPTVNPIDAAKAKILTFFEQITGGVAERDFLIKTFSKGLKQENTDEKGYFLIGSGRNGKGTAFVLVNRAIGNYFGILNVEYYTTAKKSVDEPNQNLYNCRNARLLYTSEADDVTVNNTPTKFLHDKFQATTGRDYIQARALGKPDTARFQAGIVIIALNFMVIFSHKNEDCVRERVIIQDFPFTFTSNKSSVESEPHKYRLGDSKLK
jgi:phage/plasmid-associated DNA primase